MSRLYIRTRPSGPLTQELKLSFQSMPEPPKKKQRVSAKPVKKVATEKPPKKERKKTAKKKESLTPVSYQLTLQNVVATASLGQRFPDLRIINSALCGLYCPESFPACAAYSMTPSCTQSIFTSGRVVLTGAKSEAESLVALLLALRSIRRKCGTTHSLHNFGAQNFVGSEGKGFWIDIERLEKECRLTNPKLVPKRIGKAKKNALGTTYTKELFPGVAYRLGNRRTLLVFLSGKIVATGGSCFQDLLDASASVDLKPFATKDKLVIDRKKGTKKKKAADETKQPLKRKALCVEDDSD